MSRQDEDVLGDELAEAIQNLGPRFRSWKRTNGVFRQQYSERMIRVGIVGAADRYGIIIREGRLPIPFEIEIKQGRRKKLDPDQENWRRFCEHAGIPWFMCYAASPAQFKVVAAATAQQVQQLESFHALRSDDAR